MARAAAGIPHPNHKGPNYERERLRGRITANPPTRRIQTILPKQLEWKDLENVIPASFSPTEKADAQGILELIMALGAVAKTDILALRMMLRTYAEYDRVCSRLDEEGSVYEREGKGGSAYPVAHPLLAEKSRLFSQLTRLLNDFGLTPASRRGILPIEEPEVLDEEDDEWGDILN